MEERKKENVWERTNVTNLLRNRESGTYYARVKVNGKQKWRSLKTSVSSVAKLRLGDVEKELRDLGSRANPESAPTGPEQMRAEHFITVFQERLRQDCSLAPATVERRLTALKAVVTTWPELPTRDVRRITAAECCDWATKARREGTGFIAPGAKTKRAGMSASAFNKAVDAVRQVFEVAREQGVIYRNPAAKVKKAQPKVKRLDLPTLDQFAAMLDHMRKAGSKWSGDCVDLARLLVYTGARLEEAVEIRWRDVDFAGNRMLVNGTKTPSSWRWIPLFPPLRQLVQELRERRGAEPSDSTLAQVGSCLGALRSACAAVGVKRMTHHDLRHFFATRCIEAGVDIPTVSRWLGHKDGGALAMRTYGHLRQEHSQAQAAKVTF